MGTHYKRWLTVNKVNLCWVISEGKLGHEKQSIVLAHKLAQQVKCYRFDSSFLQRLMAPHTWPFYFQSTNWHDAIPSEQPDLIISCGRHAAAAAHWLNKKKQCHHIQILNPKGNLKAYDLLLLPKHDDLTGNHICTFTGSIHNVKLRPKSKKHKLAIILGNPQASYWQNQWPIDFKQCLSLGMPTHVCGSPRLSNSAKKIIRVNCKNYSLWLDESDGTNPYEQLLNTASHFAVTIDSINMVNECLATGQSVKLLADNTPISKKHDRFIMSVKQHIRSQEQTNWPHPMKEIEKCQKIQNLLNSPSSLSTG